MTQAVETLSGGQRQGVAVARSAAFASEVVIMDEPTAALGVKESGMVLDLIRKADAAGAPLPAATAGTRTAHMVAEAQGLPTAMCGRRGKARFYRYIEELRAAGAVRAEPLRKENRHSAEVLRAN